jgi:alpha-L-arabinofuranosidase
MRQRDLTEILNNIRSKAYLGRALNIQWNVWGQYERDDAEDRDPRLRRLSRRALAERYGLKLSV